MDKLLSNYKVKTNTYDEVFSKEGIFRPEYSILDELNSSIDINKFKSLNEDAKLSFFNQGITYALYEDNETKESIFPFDLFPRVISAQEWSKLEQGMIQRNMALNLFIEDVYNDAKILKDKVIPEALIKTSKHYVKLMEGFRPVGDIYCQICGTDLIRHSDGNYYILEDNLRSPSGVSYVLSNRVALSRTFPHLFQGKMISQVSQYPNKLLETLQSVSNPTENEVTCVVLTPGQYNSAYYEHSFLAKMMGVELVEGRDLLVEDDVVYMNTIGKKKKVDVIYRRIDDDFIDPQVFNKSSMLGVSGLMKAYLKGNVSIVNAPGTGISDDKAVCAYVPDMIKYYLGEDAIISNVPTYICERPEDLQYTLDHIETLVIKPVDMSGGYGVTIMDTLSKAEVDEVKLKIQANPREYIAQPKMMLSTHLTYIEEDSTFEPRHIDLRTFTLMGKDQQYVLPGGLTRVALKRNSLIVNSSQGGGSKDTWVLMDDHQPQSQSQNQ